MKLVTVAEMKQIEQEADSSGLTYEKMMLNAGTGLADIVHLEYGERVDKKVVALVGHGNNGGDALVALARLAELGWETHAYLIRSRDDDPLVARLGETGGKIHVRSEDRNFSQLKSLIKNSSIFLDGVLGTGVQLPLKQEIAEVLDFARGECEKQKRTLRVVAVDCPSGVDCDRGEAAPECIRADLTVTMAAIKQGMLIFPAADLVGEIRVASIGELGKLKTWKSLTRFVADEDYVRSALPSRPNTAHKGTFGTAFIVAGCVNYTGAVLLSGKAAYRSGTGLVTMAIPVPLHAPLAGQFPEATWVLLPDELGVIADTAAEIVFENLSRATACLIGPGLGLEKTTQDFMDRLLEGGGESLRKSIGFVTRKIQEKGKSPALPPCVIDADGLKLLARLKDWPKRLPANSILTPHPGEMSVLTGLPKEELLADRIATAEHYAVKWGHVVIFKGAFSVIASPGGETAVIPVASPSLARAGTGDVLAGLVVGLRAQGVEAFPAAVAAAWIHARAGLQAEKKLGTSASVLAGDVLEAIPVILAGLLK